MRNGILYLFDIDCAMVHGESLSHFIRIAIKKEVLLRKADEEIMLMDKLLKLLRVGR